VLTIEPGRRADGAAWWADHGFHRIGPPAHLPSSSPDHAQVEVWIRVPEDARVGLAQREDGVWVTDWPPGTIADRVEYRGEGDARRVVDVRGTRLDEAGAPVDHLYRPQNRDPPGGTLVGYEWPAHDANAREAATDALVRRTGRESLRKKMDCVGCHVPLRPDNRRPKEHGVVSRGTDADGWFTPTTVLRDAVPVETYGRYDPNVPDPLVSATCGAEPAGLAGDGARWHCPDGVVPLATRDVARGRATSDPATRALCASRAWLAARLGATKAKVFPETCKPSRMSD